jgi:YebC/PmpR family DNA-binding regulatory protein
MSGHSKWATIKRQKSANDAKRGALFSKLGKQLAIAARAGTDPSHNSGLALAIEKAKAANMPMSNIERAIARVNDKSAAQLEEAVYEGYGPGGVAVIVEVATDNKNRTYPEVRSALTKHGGHLADPGSVAFQFSRKGVIRVKGTGEDLLLNIADAGAEDAFEEKEVDETLVYTVPNDLAKVRRAMEAAGIEIVDAEITYVPNQTVEIQDQETARKALNLMEALDDIDDVTNTHTNFEIADNINV